MPYLTESDIEIKVADTPFSTTHTHNFLEIAYVRDGEAIHRIGNTEATIGRGSYFIVDYDTPHSYYSTSDSPVTVINILFYPRLIDKSLSQCRSFNMLLNHYLIRFGRGRLRSDPSGVHFFDDDGVILSLLERMADEYKKKAPGYIEIMRSELIRLIVLTMRKIAGDETEEGPVAVARERILKNLCSPPTLSVLAAELSYSPSYLSVKFKELAGIGYRDFIAEIRITEAARLLANTVKKIPEIAEIVGYTDVNSFYKAFRRLEGMSPSEYRKNTV